MRKIRWAIIGCGNFAQTSIAPAIRKARNAQLVAFCSRDRRRAEELRLRFRAAHAYDDPARLLADRTLDAVFVTSKPEHHCEQTLLAAKHGKHVLCEKPMALNPRDARRMAKACREQGVRLMIGYTHRFEPVFIKAKGLTERGEIGDITHMSIRLSFNEPFRGDWRQIRPSREGGGSLSELATHGIDTLIYFGGAVSDCAGFLGASIHEEYVSDDSSAGLLRFRSGAFGSFYATFTAPVDSRAMEIDGTQGRLTIIPDRSKPCSRITLAGRGGVRSFAVANVDPYVNEVETFGDAILSGEPVPHDVGDAVSNTEVMSRILKSAQGRAR